MLSSNLSDFEKNSNIPQKIQKFQQNFFFLNQQNKKNQENQDKKINKHS